MSFDAGQRIDRSRSPRTISARRRRASVARVVLLFMAIASSGCTYTGSLENYLRNGFKVGPEYCPPAVEVAEHWIDEDDKRVTPEPPQHDDWWTSLNDPVLTKLILTASQQNLSLEEAGWRVLESRAMRGIAIGEWFPQQQRLVGEYRRTQLSRNNLASRPVLESLVPREFDNWATGFDAAWELDFWGKFRRNILSAEANFEASVDHYDDILLCLLADTAASYVQMRTAEQRLRLVRDNVKIQEGSLGIAEAKFKGGETTDLDVEQAKINVANTEALIPELEKRRRHAQIRLCVLLGMPPKDLSHLLGEGKIPTAPESVAIGIPADLLRRRPDVREAERDVAAQSEQIGVAAADILPQFVIKGAIRYEANRLDDLFQSSSAAGGIAPAFNWPVLNYGRLANNVVLQDAKFRQLAVRYQQTVLRANADVERAIASFVAANEQVQKLEEAVAASKRAVKIAQTQYREGTINYLNVFSLESVLVEEQDSLARAQGDVIISLISIYKAIGGGWETFCGGVDAAIEDGTAVVVAEDEVEFVVPDAEEIPTPALDER
ncbi:MAG: efflux transporter outer membrane subunit [Pirellulales bacterium]|nr:efflux transporter outer membrane subunit [Pirellulales bacterium]